MTDKVTDTDMPEADAPEGADATEAAKPKTKGHRWYIVNAYSNFEKKVAEAIQERASSQGLDDEFTEILVPTEDVIEVRRGRKINAERKFFPGYVLVKMRMTDQAYHLVKNTPKVSGFLGSGKKPMPVSQSEVDRIMGNMQESAERPKSTITFEVGENVKVIDGPFKDFNGVVEEVDDDRTRLKAAVSIFGRPTPVELDYNQVEKVSN